MFFIKVLKLAIL